MRGAGDTGVVSEAGTRAWRAGWGATGDRGVVPLGLNKWAREFRVCLPVPESVSIPGCTPQASGQASACATLGGSWCLCLGSLSSGWGWGSAAGTVWGQTFCGIGNGAVQGVAAP